MVLGSLILFDVNQTCFVLLILSCGKGASLISGLDRKFTAIGGGVSLPAKPKEFLLSLLLLLKNGRLRAVIILAYRRQMDLLR